ncbi:hypothetical protein LVX13_35580 [Streptomyces albulus]|uniref:hypothetical protein n=1 Tax=Streptomyces noursei TaxID=1971 RepID=UPI001F24BC6A|nr:hypothetical protein [Streptomyces noursei]MCE4948387.1 hypothetical protein [Streptomyces noursei]
MSVFTAVHIHRPTFHLSIRSRNTARTLLGLLVTAARRIADSPLDSPVLHTLPGPDSAAGAATESQPARPHAHWHTVTDPTGRRRLEADWHVTN